MKYRRVTVYDPTGLLDQDEIDTAIERHFDGDWGELGLAGGLRNTFVGKWAGVTSYYTSRNDVGFEVVSEYQDGGIETSVIVRDVPKPADVWKHWPPKART